MPLLRSCVLPRLGAPVLLILAAGCSPSDAPPPRPDPAGPGSAAIPAWGSEATFEVGTWNVDWFGDSGNGPGDEALQLRGLREVIGAAAVDLWALQEVVDPAAFDELVAALPGYEGLIADDPAVVGGPEWYRDFGDREQKLALIWRTEEVEVVAARVVLTEENHAFAGRPPVELELRLDPDGASIEAVVVLLHAKASADEESRARRQRGAEALHRHLAATWPTRPVWVLGDFNDDVDTSIVRGAASPYRVFVEAEDWSFATSTLSEQGVSSTVGYADVIDHHLLSDEAAAWYVGGSAEAWRVDRWIDDFGRTTTDHYPVFTRYTLPGR